MKTSQSEQKVGRQRFIDGVEQLLQELGAQPCDFLSYNRALETPLGKLYFKAEPATGKSSDLGWIAGRFDSHELAFRFVDINPFSGKWNHHYFGDWTPEDALFDLEVRLRKVLDVDTRTTPRVMRAGSMERAEANRRGLPC
jgi:hypothetical protein